MQYRPKSTNERSRVSNVEINSSTLGVIRSRSAARLWSHEIEIGAGGIRSAVPAAEIARGRADVHSVISVGIPVSDSQKKFKGTLPLGGGGIDPEIFVVT